MPQMPNTKILIQHLEGYTDRISCSLRDLRDLMQTCLLYLYKIKLRGLSLNLLYDLITKNTDTSTDDRPITIINITYELL